MTNPETENTMVHQEQPGFVRWGGFQGFRHGLLRFFAVGAHISPGPVLGFGVTLLGFHFDLYRIGGDRGYTGINTGFPFFSYGFMWPRFPAATAAGGTPIPAGGFKAEDAIAARKAKAAEMLENEREWRARNRPGRADIVTLPPVGIAELDGCTDACCPNEVNHVPGQNTCGCVSQ